MNVEHRLYQRGARGTWWADFGEVGGIRHRRSLGTSDPNHARTIALNMAAELRAHADARRVRQLVDPPAPAQWLKCLEEPSAAAFFAKLWANARGRARRDNLLWALSLEDLMSLARLSCGRCAVTGLAFDLSGPVRGPLQPSLDRIDCGTGYSPGNCRLTLLAVNVGMNVWGDALFTAIALSFAAKKLEAAAQLSHSHFSQSGKRA